MMTEETYQQLIKTSEKNITFNPRSKKVKAFLSSILICGRCGSYLHQRWNGNYKYYSCAKKIKHLCDLPSIRQEITEREIWSVSEILLEDPQQFELALKQANEELDNINLEELIEIEQGLDKRELDLLRGQRNTIKEVEQAIRLATMDGEEINLKALAEWERQLNNQEAKLRMKPDQPSVWKSSWKGSPRSPPPPP